MEQQLAIAIGIVILTVRLLVDGDVSADEPRLAVTHVGVGLLQRGASVAERLHLGPGEDESGLDALEQLVFVARAAVVHDELFA